MSVDWGSAPSWVAAVGGVGAAFTAAFNVWIASRALSLQSKSVRATNRPMLQAMLLMPDRPIDVCRMQISNEGKSTAFDVRVTFEPELPMPDLAKLRKRSEEKYGKRIHYEQTLIGQLNDALAEPIDTITPGLELQFDYWAPFTWEESAEGIPAKTKVVLAYFDSEGNEFKESFGLNPNIYRGARWVTKKRNGVTVSEEQV